MEGAQALWRWRVVFRPHLFGSYFFGQGEGSKRNTVTTALHLISETGIAGAAPVACGCKEKPEEQKCVLEELENVTQKAGKH